MHYITLLVLCCLFLNLPVSLGIHTEGRSVELAALCYRQVPAPKSKPKLRKKWKKKRPPFQTHTELVFLQLALYLSVVAGLTVFIGYNLAFIFISLFLVAGFFWFLSGLFAMMAVVLMLVRIHKNQKEQNEQVGWYLLLFILTRIVFFVFIGIAVSPIAAILLSVFFIPAFIAYLTTLLAAFGNYATKKDKDLMFDKEEE